MNTLVGLGTQLFGEFTNLVGAIAPAIDGMLGTNVLGTLIAQMGLPGFAGLVLFGMISD